MKDDILATIQAITPDMVAIRHDIHAPPRTRFRRNPYRRPRRGASCRSFGLEVTTAGSAAPASSAP